MPSANIKGGAIFTLKLYSARVGRIKADQCLPRQVYSGRQTPRDDRPRVCRAARRLHPPSKVKMVNKIGRKNKYGEKRKRGSWVGGGKVVAADRQTCGDDASPTPSSAGAGLCCPCSSFLLRSRTLFATQNLPRCGHSLLFSCLFVPIEH